MAERQNFCFNPERERAFGYARAVRVGNQVFCSGATGFGPNGETVGLGDMYAQARQALRNVERALAMAGAELRHVVRTRVYVTDASRWEEAGRAHGEVFGDIQPACTYLVVTALANPERLVEIDADALVD